ncbi:hypothetical protein KCU93_g3472, partial [Aureobasidium melanogenum]
MVHVEDEFMTYTSSEEANAKLGTNSAVAIAEEHPFTSNTLSTPEKPATLDNAKVLLRKADKLLFGKMARSHSQGEEGSETLISPSSPWSSPSSNESEDDLKKARGLLRSAHNMLELVGSKKNDEIWKRGQHYEEAGSPYRSAELREKDVMNWEAETAAEQSCVAELQGQIYDLEAQLREALADLDKERKVTRQLQKRLRL